MVYTTLHYCSDLCYSSSAYWVRLAKWSVRLSANHSVPRKGLQGNTSSDTRQKRKFSFQITNMPSNTCTHVPTSHNDTDYFQVLVFFTVLPEASFIGKLLRSVKHTRAFKYIFMEAILQETVTNSFHCLQPENNIIIS